ncbi:MAG TPA: class I SAM-dependent methyltransferase [Planctomycetota bacterium]|nr:class I SAM-dependent methyltransferase [Planctomycetota bacterium]
MQGEATLEMEMTRLPRCGGSQAKESMQMLCCMHRLASPDESPIIDITAAGDSGAPLSGCRHSKPAERRIPDDFYERIKPRLYRRIGRELRLARYVLDLGCGSCGLVRYLAETYRQQVTGVDVVPDSFPKRPKGVRFRCLRRDAAHLAFAADGSADAIVTMWALHEMKRPQAILAEARRVLRAGGELLVVDFPRDSLAQKLWNENYYRPEQVRRLLAEMGFSDIRVRLIERDQVIWARAHKPVSENGPEATGNKSTHMAEKPKRRTHRC